MHYATILVESNGPVTLIGLNRPEALNALNQQVSHDLALAFPAFDGETPLPRDFCDA